MPARPESAHDGDERDPWEQTTPTGERYRPRYSAAEVDALASRAARKLDELRGLLAEIAAKMGALTEGAGATGDEGSGPGAAG